MSTILTRSSVYKQFWRWKQAGKWMHDNAFGHLHKHHPITVTTSKHFARLMGRATTIDRLTDDILSEAETQIAEKLLGPHGYTYYRALLIQREHEWGLDDFVYVSTFNLIRGEGHKGYSNSYSDGNVTEEDVRVFKLLLGPNGYAVYKMLRLKRGLK